MESPVETAARFGIKPNQLPDLLELQPVAEALVLAREAPDIAPEAIMAKLDLPMVDPDGLDVDKLMAEATSQRLRRERLEDVGRRGDGTTRPRERVEGSGVMIGRMEKAEKKSARLLDAMERIDTLLADITNGGLPATSNVRSARIIAKEALR